uniref:Myosin heavy chain n=1 Tax=Anisakis simplex TaxID=6269 RepID=A0A0M3KHR6_ANISI
LASLNLQKYRQIQHQLDDAEERAEDAETSFAKMRTKSRSTLSVAPGGGGGGGGGLRTSQSSAGIRSASARPRGASPY